MTSTPTETTRPELAAAWTVAAAIVIAAVGAIVVSRVSLQLFVVAEGLLVALIALAGLRWPRAVLVGVVLSPIVDRYVLAGLIAPDAEALAHFFSEALLSAVGATLLVQAARRGTLRAAFNHRSILLAVAFVAIAALSALINHVPLTQAVAGIGFTVDALALFVLARVVGFGPRQALVAIGAVIVRGPRRRGGRPGAGHPVSPPVRALRAAGPVRGAVPARRLLR